MPLKWSRGEFRVTGPLMTRTMFERWLDGDGRRVLREEVESTRFRWFFRSYRARCRLYGEARATFRRGGTFAAALSKELDRLSGVVRSCGLVIRRSGYRHLLTFDDDKVVAVVPRAVVQNDFKVVLLRELVELRQVKRFRGLVERVVESNAAEAENLLFKYLARGNTLVDSTGNGIILDVDSDFRWRLEGSNGHYYYAYKLDEKRDLTDRKERRRFVASVNEMYKVQCVHMKRLQADEINDVVDALRLRKLVRRSEGGTHDAHARVRVQVMHEADEVLHR